MSGVGIGMRHRHIRQADDVECGDKGERDPFRRRSEMRRAPAAGANLTRLVARADLRHKRHHHGRFPR